MSEFTISAQPREHQDQFFVPGFGDAVGERLVEVSLAFTRVTGRYEAVVVTQPGKDPGNSPPIPPDWAEAQTACPNATPTVPIQSLRS